MRKLPMLVVMLMVVVSSSTAVLAEVMVTPEFVEATNQKIQALGKKWKASTDVGHVLSGATREDVKGLCGVKGSKKKLPRKTFTKEQLSVPIPKSFSSTENWPNCSTISKIADQSACGSCWAVAAVTAMSDRYCTYGGPKNLTISARDLMSCCTLCGDGCQGGFPGVAWSYWNDNGLRSEVCQPYPFPKCEHHIKPKHPLYPPCPKDIYDTPSCVEGCTGNGSHMSGAFYKGKTSYSLYGESDFQREIMANGPIEVAFTVYRDFLTYKSGVYETTSYDSLGGHAVKMTGWGETDDGTKYWVIHNSWNEQWGMEGKFWILRGADECGIEDDGTAGAPKLN